jgi:acetaldehyde dehydrogenase / alcohol dehydrogenase
MMHNAACIAAMAFSNASVGVNHALAHAFGAHFHVAHGRANALMLPHVIAYNASVPSKFMPSPNTQGYVAHKKVRYGCGPAWPRWPHYGEEKVKKLISGDRTVARPPGRSAFDRRLGISKEEFERAMPELTKNAFEDPSWRTNPRMPLISELSDLFWKAYQGRSPAKVVNVSQQQTA